MPCITPQRLQSLVVLNSVFNRTAEQRAGVIARTAQAAEHGPDANAEAALSRWFSREYQAANPAQIAAIAPDARAATIRRVT